MINDYFIASAKTPTELGVVVRRFLDDGWQPLGGPIADNSAAHWIYQALVKHES